MWMDEGYYDFRWMSDGWNWVIYFVYTTIITALALRFIGWPLGIQAGPE